MSGSTNFPTALDNNTTLSDLYQDGVDDVNAAHVNNLAAAVKAIEAKLGINSSGVTTTVDYFINTVMGRSGSNISPTGTLTLTSGNFGSPVTQAFGDAASAGTGTLFARSNHVHGMPTNPGISYKYKTSASTYTSNTTLADVPATSGNMAFAVAANTDYLIQYTFYQSIPVVGGAVAGIKYAFTFPASPTATILLADVPYFSGFDGTDGHYVWTPGSTTHVFSTSLTSGTAWFSQASASSGPGATSGLVRIQLLFRNGANAGTVTLQAAQHGSSASSSSISGGFATAQIVSAA